MGRSENISPTAYATGHMWYRHGLSHPGLVTRKGQIYDAAFGALTGLVRRAAGVSFDALMLARHRGIDGQLEQAIASGKVTQVIELAAGLSARGWRFCKHHGEGLSYIESDLPQMVEEKRRLLKRAQIHFPQHRVEVIDVLQAGGDGSLEAIAAQLDPNQGLAIITEGLMNYLAPEQAEQLWRRIARCLQGFSHGVYLSDFYLRSENQGWTMRAFAGVLQRFVKGRLHVHFAAVEEAQQALQGLGFARVDVHQTIDLPATHDQATDAGAERVRVLEAWVG